jgi:predicted DNA-binding protein YlxM (UPF0122 family)
VPDPLTATESAPHGPLSGGEFGHARQLLTDKQFHAYRHFRDGKQMGWIANRLGNTRQAVMQLVVKAEKKLGYEPSFTPKQKHKPPYKSVAQRQAEAEKAEIRRWAEILAEIPPSDRPRVLRRLYRLIESEMQDEEKARRFRKRLYKQFSRERRADEWEGDPELATPGDFAAALEADFPGMKPQDFVKDWGHD